MTYALADRVAVKAGELDREARVTNPSFVVAGGSFVSRLDVSDPDAYLWRDAERDLFGVRVLDVSAGEPDRLSGGLVTAE
jgi:hypothetical protein